MIDWINNKQFYSQKQACWVKEINNILRMTAIKIYVHVWYKLGNSQLQLSILM